jgi:hypothetical protein
MRLAAMKSSTAATVPFQTAQQLLFAEALGIVEVDAPRLRERLVAIGDHVEEVTNRDDLTEFQVVKSIDQQLQHRLQRRALALQGRRHGDQGLHQRRLEFLSFFGGQGLAIWQQRAEAEMSYIRLESLIAAKSIFQLRYEPDP